MGQGRGGTEESNDPLPLTALGRSVLCNRCRGCLSSPPTPTGTPMRPAMARDKSTRGGDGCPIPHPAPAPTARVLGRCSPANARFLPGRWFLYLLVPVLFCRVGGSIHTPQKLFGEVTSPLYPKPYPNNFETTTVITVPVGYRVKLVFRQFDLEPSEGCFYDYVKVGGSGGVQGRCLCQ